MSIYFIAPETMETVKIGFSRSPRRRLYALRNASPHPLRILSVIDGDLSDEADLHTRFSEYRMNGEWFSVRGELEDFLAELPPYRFDRKSGVAPETLHSDAAAIDRIGISALREHFDVTRQAIFYWRRTGVPKKYRNTLAMLGKQRGLPMPEMAEPRTRELA